MEVVDRCAAALQIGFGRLMLLRLHVRVVNQPSLGATVGECAGDADGPDGIQPVGVLDYLPFQGEDRLLDAGSLKGDVGNDPSDVLDHAPVHAEPEEPLPCRLGADRQVAVMRLPVSDIVKQSGKFHDEEVYPFSSSDPLGRLPDPAGVPPVVTAPFARKAGLHEAGGAVDEIEWRHRLRQGSGVQ